MPEQPVNLLAAKEEADARKFCTPEFVFKNVLTWPYFSFYLIALIAAAPAALFFMLVIYGRFQYGGLSVTFGIWVLCIMLFNKSFSKTVIIYFDRNSMYISGADRVFKQYPKNQVLGIYSYDYEQQLKPFLSIVIKFTNGKNLYLTDANPFGRNEALFLRMFFVAAKKRLNLSLKAKNRWRAFQRLGANWYVPTNNDN